MGLSVFSYLVIPAEALQDSEQHYTTTERNRQHTGTAHKHQQHNTSPKFGWCCSGWPITSRLCPKYKPLMKELWLLTPPLLPLLALPHPPLGKGRHLSRSQSLRSVDNPKRDDTDKAPRSGQQSPQEGKTTGRRGIPCISHCGSLGDQFTFTTYSCDTLQTYASIKISHSSALSTVDYFQHGPWLNIAKLNETEHCVLSVKYEQSCCSLIKWCYTKVKKCT